MVSPAKTMIPAPDTHTDSTEANAFDPGSHKNGGSAEDNEREKTKCLSGFIFLCNQTTKLQCYQYRVFGLPLAKKEVVKEIKSGSKLFLFDFKSKLLYGVYEATSDGNLNLEPEAFGGQFPAQVKFKIFKECLPIPESSLKYAIKENYTGAFFKQELNRKQVTKLISCFRPLAASTCQPSQQALAHVPRPGAIPPSQLEYQYNLTGRLPMMGVPYVAEVQYNNIRPSAEARPVLNVTYPEHGSHRRAAYVENVHPTLDHQSLPAASSYVSHPQRQLFAEDVARRVQEPSYSGYTTVEQRASHDEVALSGGQYHQLPLQKEALYQDNPASYYSNSTATNQYPPSVLPLQGRQYQDSLVAHSSNPAAPVQYTTSDYWQQGHEPYLPLPQESSVQGNVTAYNSNLIATPQYASTVLQTRAPVPYDQSSLGGPQYQDSAAAYSSNPAAPTPYTTSISQAPYLPLQREALYQDNVVSYNSNPTVAAQYTSFWQPQWNHSNPTVPAEYTSTSQPQWNHSNPTVPAENTSILQAQWNHSNPTVPAEYTSISQPQWNHSNPTVPAEYTSISQPQWNHSNPTVPAEYTSISQPQWNHSNPTVPAEYTSIPQPQWNHSNPAVPAENTSVSQGEALH